MLGGAYTYLLRGLREDRPVIPAHDDEHADEGQRWRQCRVLVPWGEIL